MEILADKQQLLDRVATICSGRAADVQSITPVYDKINESLLGIVLAFKDEDVRELYYPAWFGRAVINFGRALDRLAVASYIDENPSALIYTDPLCHRVLVAAPWDSSGIEIPITMVHHSNTLKYLCAALSTNNETASNEVLKDVAAHIYGVEIPDGTKAMDAQPETAIAFAENSTRLRIHDRLDFIKFFDDVLGSAADELTGVKYADGTFSGDKGLVSADGGVFATVPMALQFTSAVVRHVLREKSTDRAVTKYIQTQD